MSSPLPATATNDDDEVHFTSPRRLSFDGTTTHHHSSPARARATPSPLNPVLHVAPPSPGSPWSLSPLRASPPPSLLHHCIASLHRHEGNIYSIALAKGVVFTGSDSSRIRAWRHPDCTERGYVKASCGHVRAVLAYGNALFSAHKDHKIRIWNFTLSDGCFRIKKVSTLPRTRRFSIYTSSKNNSSIAPRQQQHRDNISSMAYYHAEGLLYTASYDRTVKVWRVHDKKCCCVDSFQAHDESITSVLVNQEDGCVFTASFDGSVKVWRRVYRENSHTLTMTLRFQHSPVNALALTATTTSREEGGGGCCFLYSGSSDGTINFWEKEKFSGRFNHSGFLQGHRFAVLCLAAAAETRLVFSGSEDTSIRVWRREEGGFHECLAVLDGHRGPVRCLVVCLETERVGNGFLVYSAGLDQSFKVWRVKVLMEDNSSSNGEKLGMGLVEYCQINNGGDEGLMKRRNSNVDSISTTTVADLVSSNYNSSKVMEYEMSPVLSPSWVEKKLKRDNFL